MIEEAEVARLLTKSGIGKSPSTHITLLARLRQNSDVEAWRVFVDLYTPLVYRYCRLRGLQDADASDVTQQVLAIVHRRIDTFQYDRERGRFRNWLGVVTAHEITRYLRRDRRPGKGMGGGLGTLAADHENRPADPTWIDEFNAYIFSQALTRIRPEFNVLLWRAFELTWLQDVKPQEAAAELSKTAAWVYKARYKVLQRLHEEVEFLTSDAAMFQRPS